MLAVDSRSEKLEQLERNPHAAICWYFSKTREQFRLTGQIAIVTESGVVYPQANSLPDIPESDRSPDIPESDIPESDIPGPDSLQQSNWQQMARLQLWGRLSDSAKLLWYWPRPKGDRDDVDAFLSQPPADSIHPPDTFVLLLFDATEVDRLQLKGEPQNRTIFSHQSDGWQVRNVNP